MKRNRRLSLRKLLWTGLTAAILPLSLAAGQEKKTVAPGTPVTITVTQAQPASPPVSISLGSRHGHVTPTRQGFTHTGGGNIDIQQPSSDTVVITMTGVAVAGGHPCKDSVAALHFDLDQDFEISFDDPKVKKAKLTLEGRVIGLLRSHGGKKPVKKCGGTAEESCGTVAVGCGPIQVISLTVSPHSVGGGENLSINDHDGPVSGPIVPGQYKLHQSFRISASHPRSLLPCKAASSEFAPDPALDPLWISHWEPFHGAAKKDFGFQVTVKVADDSSAPADEKKPAGK